MKKTVVVGMGVIWMGLFAAQAELVAHWNFDGSLKNATGEQFELKPSGWSQPVYSDDAHIGSQSVCFGNPPGGGPNTATDRLWVSGGAKLGMGSGSWSFAAWIKPSEEVVSGAMTVFSAEGTDTKWKLYCDIRENNAMSLFFKNNDSASVPEKIGSGFWAHPGNWSLLVVVFDSTAGTVSMYRYSEETSPKNVKSEGVVLRKQMRSKFDITIKSFALGYNAGNAGNGFKGLMDDVRIYNHALSEQEIAGLADVK